MLTHHDEIKQTLTHPENYFGAINDWIDAGYGPTFGRHRDSDQLALSNYYTVLHTFEEKFEHGLDFVTESSTHFLVGWTEDIIVRVLDCKCGEDVVQDRVIEYTHKYQFWYCKTCETICTESKIFQECLEFKARLEDYPVLDEEDFSNREHEDMMSYLEQEVGDEHAPALFTYLFDTHQVSRSDEVHYKWIEEWKEANIKDD
jgi:hypothetical protein